MRLELLVVVPRLLPLILQVVVPVPQLVLLRLKSSEALLKFGGLRAAGVRSGQVRAAVVRSGQYEGWPGVPKVRWSEKRPLLAPPIKGMHKKSSNSNHQSSRKYYVIF